MNPNDFHDKAHVWGWHMPMEREATCWCEPFIGHGAYIEGMVFHRPDPWWLFWNYGEQGPRTVQQTDEMNEHEARMLGEKLGISG